MASSIEVFASPGAFAPPFVSVNKRGAMPTTLHIDFETRSTVALRETGVHVYASHPSTAVWCMAYAFDGEEPQIWHPGAELPREIQDHVIRGGTVVAHNAAFETTIWNLHCTLMYGWPVLSPEQTQCTMAMAYAMSLPGGLGDCATALNLDYKKDDAGRRLMLQMCKPRRVEPDGTPIWWDDADRRARLAEYCRQDVRVEHALFRTLLPLIPQEQRVYQIDQIVNNRGVQVDTLAVRRAMELVAHDKRRLDEAMRRVTGGAVPGATATGRLREWLRHRGVETTGVAKADVTEMLSDALIPPDVRAALRIRKEAGKSSTAKLDKILAGASGDGRLRGLFQYHGAGTGRWAGRRVQPHNFPRPALTQHQIEVFVDSVLCELGISIPAAADMVDNFMGDVTSTVADSLRAMLTASPGKDLIAADFSAIEARGLAWLAGEESVLEVFRGHGKIYELAAAGIYKVRIEDVTEAQRQIGKVAVLALGYQGGVGAFQQLARGYGVQVSDEEAEAIKVAWRAANKNIVRYWYALERAAIEAVRLPGSTTQAGPTGRRVKFRKVADHMWCRLPSGRLLCYPFAELDVKPGYAKLKHKSTDSTRGGKWGETSTYGGKLAENITQAFCRDLLSEAMLRLEEHGYPVVMHVHDEIVCEVPEGFGSVEEMESTMAVVPPWAKDMPIRAEGWRGKRYRK